MIQVGAYDAQRLLIGDTDDAGKSIGEQFGSACGCIRVDVCEPAGALTRSGRLDLYGSPSGSLIFETALPCVTDFIDAGLLKTVTQVERQTACVVRPGGKPEHATRTWTAHGN